MIQGLQQAYEQACIDLLAEMEPQGHWIGELSSSALSTATTVSALSATLALCTAHGRISLAEKPVGAPAPESPIDY